MRKVKCTLRCNGKFRVYNCKKTSRAKTVKLFTPVIVTTVW